MIALIPAGDKWELSEIDATGKVAVLSTHAKLFDAAKELLHVATTTPQYAPQVAGVSL